MPIRIHDCWCVAVALLLRCSSTEAPLHRERGATGFNSFNSALPLPLSAPLISEMLLLRRCLLPRSRATLTLSVPSTFIAYHSYGYYTSAAAASSAPWFESRISHSSYAANDPIEDRWAYMEHGDSLAILSVYDGHGGWQAAEFARVHLGPTIVREFASNTVTEDPGQIASAMIRAFERVDREFISAIRPAFKVGFGEVAHVGCCAIAAVVTPTAIVVANAGDCRAVLGRRAPVGTPFSTASSESLQYPGRNSSGAAGTASTAMTFADRTSAEAASLLSHAGVMSSNSMSAKSAKESDMDAELSRIASIRGGVDAAATQTALLGPPSLSSSPVLLRGGFQAIALSEDHNARMPREQAQLRLLHPEEDDVVYQKPLSGAWYVKQRLQPTRALGDAYLKYSEFNGVAGNRQTGRHIPALFTPPYIQSKPETRVYRLSEDPADSSSSRSSSSTRSGGVPSENDASSSSSPGRNFTSSSTHGDAFVILACDGVWDVMSNEEAVSFIASDTGDRSTIASRFVQRVLEKEASAAHWSVSQLMAVPPGRKRRQMHDDITALIYFLGDKPGGVSSARRGKQGTSWLDSLRSWFT